MPTIGEVQSKSNRLWESRLDVFESSCHEHQFGDHSPEFLQMISELEIASVLASIPISPKFHVLDIGAGGGRWSLAFLGRVTSVTALEPSPLYKILAKRLIPHHNVRVFNQSLEEFKTDKSYDLIVIYGTLMYLIENNHVNFFLQKAASLVKDGGFLVLGEAISKSTKYMVDWQYVQVRQDLETQFKNCRYWEIIRNEQFYISTCKKHGLKLRTSFLSHTPFFYHLPIKNKNIQEKWRKFLINCLSVGNISHVKIYNKMFRKISEILLKSFDKRYMKIFIFQKGD